MDDPLTRILDMAGASTTDKDECYLFVLGERGTGKSTFIRSLSKENDIKVSPPTYGYSYTVMTFQSVVSVHIFEFNNVISNLSLLKSLLKKTPEKSCIIFVCRPNSPSSINKMKQEFINPVLNECLSEYNNSDMQKKLEQYYSTIIATENSQQKNINISTSTFLPFIIAAIADPSSTDKQFNSYSYIIRKAALNFGSGVILSTEPDIFTIISSIALRRQLPIDLIQNQKGIILPGSDSNEEIEKIEHEDIIEKVNSPKKVEEKVVPNWQTFLQNLSDVKVQTPQKLSLIHI